MTKRRKPTEESQRVNQQDEDYIPLPIQTFLWRQTSPFVRPFLGKARDLAQIEQRDACKLFERIIITNNIWGQSPSLTDAIASIDRWRLIKVSFPFVLQCTAALLNNKLIKDHNFNRLGGNEAKMMYTLQWILMNASEECADSENEAKANATSVAIAAATAASLLKPTSASTSASQLAGTQPVNNQAGISQGSTSSQSTTNQEQHQHHQATISTQISHNVPITSSINHPQTIGTRGCSTSSCANQSIIIPAASAAASAAAIASPSGMNSLQMQATLPSSNSVSPIGSSTPTKPLTPTQSPTSPSNYLLPISSIQMFVYYFGPIIDKLKHSDFLTSNQRLEIGAAMWEPLFNHQLPRVGCLSARVKPRLSESSPTSSFFSNDLNQFAHSKKPEQLGAILNASIMADRRRSSTTQHDPAQFGEVFLGGPTPVATRAQTEANMLKHGTSQLKPSGSIDQFEDPQELNYATYLDIAVLRCLFVSDWQESGVYWAITFLSNRLAETCYYDDNSAQLQLRPRSKSLSEFNCRDFKVFMANSSNDERNIQQTDVNALDEKQTSRNKAKKVKESKSSAGGRFLKVEDAETSDSGGDGSKETKSPVRRLSFSSGMQTLANQIRKTSKRVKKNDNQQASDNLTSDSQTNIQASNSDLRNLNLQSKSRRSSSADDLNASQLSTLSMLHKQSASQDGRAKDRKHIESNPVITVTTNVQNLEQKSKANKSGKTKKGRVKTNQQGERLMIAPKAHPTSLRNLEKLVRSQSTPRNLHYSTFRTRKDQADQTEFAGASHYLDNVGRIDPLVVLKVLHTISQRESACSQRVCDKILSLVKKLISIGILKKEYSLSRRTSHEKDLTNLLPTRQQEYRLLNENTPFVLQIDLEQQLNLKQQLEEATKKVLLIHKILIDIVFRLYYHLGCPNHCGFESTVDHHHQAHQTKLHSVSGKSSLGLGTNENISERSLRTKLKESIELLCYHNKINFVQYIQDIVNGRALQQIIDIFHSVLGFCRPDSASSNAYSQQSSTSAHNPSVQFMPTPSTSSTNLNESLATKAATGGSLSSNHSEMNVAQENRQSRHTTTMQPRKGSDSIETIIVTNSFKHLITRISSINKELKLQENTSLYCDIRRLISFVRDGHNNVFRSVILSALIDCAKMMNHQQKMISLELINQRRTGDITRPPSDDESTAMNTNIRREKIEGNETREIDPSRVQETHGPSSSSIMHVSPSTMCHSGSVLQHQTSFGSFRQYPVGSVATFNQQDQQHGQSSGILSLSKAKKKLEQVFGVKQGGKNKTNSSQLGEELVQTSSLCGNDGEIPMGTITSDEASRRASLIGHQSMNSFNENNSRTGNNYPTLPQSPLNHRLINIQKAKQNQEMYAAVQVGMTNFSFMMESCAPSDFLDPALLAALLDLKSPIAVRAAIYLECANFVHRCNRGQWPPWMRMSVTTVHRNSTAGIMQSGGGGKHRKSSSMQRTTRNNTLMYRAAGRAFYAWAEAIGSRLEELTQNELDSIKKDAILEDTETSETQVASEPATVTSSQLLENQILSEVDFFQPVIGNSASPFALKMAACQLLFEVTTFLRETYRYLPPTIVHHQASTSKLGDKMTSIYDVSRAVTANRRWSMALSSLGFGQLPATLSAISAGGGASSNSGSHLRNPTTTSISEHPERRISFILHETNDENENQDRKEENSQDNSQVITSPLAPSVNTSEQQQDAMRKMTAGRHLSQSSASSAVVVAAATCLLRSSGVIDSQSHRRKSIKLRKTPQDKEQKDKRTKFAQDLDEELENSSISDVGVRRTDSMKSRRRVSGISEKSDTSDQRANGLPSATHDGQHVDLSGDDSAGNGSCEENFTETAEKFEADESRIMSNMPWFKAIALVNSTVDCNCNHYPTCSANCYKMHQTMCLRLITSVQSIYQDSESERDYASSIFESRLSNFINLGNQQKVFSQDSKNTTGGVARAGSDCSAHIQSHSDTDNKRKEKRLKKHQQLDSIHDDMPNASPRSRKSQNRMQSMMSFHLDSIASANETSTLMADALKALTAAKAKKRATAQRNQEEPQIVKYNRANVKSLIHCPLSSFLKGAVILPREAFIDMIRFSWNLLLEDDQQLARTAAVGFIISAIKCPSEAAKLLLEELECKDASRKISAINKFYVIWDTRYHCWPRLEDGAFVHFKMLPPSIEFTLPSPKIAQESKPVVDPPWMPRKTSNVEEVTINQDQSVQKSFVTATKTRRKQQIEIVTKALREKCDKLREDRENYHITSVPITLYAAYEPTLGAQSTDEIDGDAGDEDAKQENRALQQMKTAQALFPSCLCQAAIVMINLLDDSRVTFEGSAVYEVANKVVWSCLVEDPSLFLRYFFERLTKQNQNTIFQVLRRLIRFMPRLPSQAAYTLYNHLIGFVIHYIRSPPPESSQKLIADTLSVLCLVVPSVYGLFLKDLKQILRKEQCDHNLLITANVPSAKKIIILGSDSSEIPSQFPIEETTQFYHILVDSLEFFGIDKPKHNEYFLIDVRTNHMHNLHSYVRDYYSFKRSSPPELQLINMDPNKAFDILQKQELVGQFLEFGKVSMSLSIVKSTHMAVQRVLFLHEELMKLPTFPRKALETNFSLFRGSLGHQVFSMDRIHKICWVRLIARMFELTSGFFLQLGDIHLFLNAISGIFVLHCEEASVSRLCLATFINASYQFKNIFATDGFVPIMSTIVQVYSNHQNNQLLCRSIEFVCKQFYIMHRKPFLLQLFGSVASRLNTAELMQNQASFPLSMNQPSGGSSSFIMNDPSRISPTAFFRLLQSLEKAFKDPLDILELVDIDKPLRAVDFCYQQDKEAIEILDIISLCVTVTAYASESPRSTQMLIILETVVPLYMKHLQASTSKKAGQSMGKQAHKDELQKIQSISICIRTLIVNCEGLTRNFNGPLPSIDFRSSSIRRTGPSGTKSTSSQQKGQNNSAGSPVDLYYDEPSYSGTERRRDQRVDVGARQGTIVGGVHRGAKNYNSEESEITRGEFIVPRDTLLNLVAEFLSLSTGRLVESAKKYVELHQKHASYELLDVKSHLRLAEVANSLLKFASTDPSVMACRGLTRYINEILPNTEWRQEAIRPALIMILKRLDKTFNRIAKKTWVKRSTDWEGAKQLLKGAYLTFIKHPYIVHLPHLKSLINCCQNIILSDGLQSTNPVMPSYLFHGFASSQVNQTGVAVAQSASIIPQQTTERSLNNLLNVKTHTGTSLTPSSVNVVNQTKSAPNTAQAQQLQQNPSFAAISSAATLAERLANANTSSSIVSQGFNSVTIRLIAMQLLQTGDSQTLESFIGNSLNTPEKLESSMLNLIYPMCIRVCSGAREAPKLRACDITFILNLVLNMLAPQSASSKSCSASTNSPKSTTDTSQFILSKITTTIGSTQTGATALGIVGSSAHSTGNSHQIAQHQEALKIGFLGLKILCVCFEAQLASEWIRVSRVIRDLALNSKPSGPLWDFLDFIATYRFPVFILLVPMIKCHLARKVRTESFTEDAAYYIQCQRLIETKIQGAPPTVCRSKSFLFVSLTAELRMLKEQLIAKRRMLIEGERQASSHASQASQANQVGMGSSSPNQIQGDGSQQGDHFTAYHRLSAAIASFASQSTQGKITPSASSSNTQLGTSAALRGTCFAAQLATSTPITNIVDKSTNKPLQSSIRLSTAKSREEARKVMNTILRRTSYPHNQSLNSEDQLPGSERKNSQPPSPSTSRQDRSVDVEAGNSGNQIIMDPAMLMAAFPPKRSTAEGSGILKQLIQTIDRQNQKQPSQQQQKQTYQTTTLTTTGDQEGIMINVGASSSLSVASGKKQSTIANEPRSHEHPL